MSIEDSTQSRLLRISNIHSSRASDTSSNFTVNLNRMTETNSIIRCVCKSVSFPNTGYNIFTDGAKKNNEFYYEIGGSTYTHNITTPGFYSAKELIDILQPVILADLELVSPGIGFTMEIGKFSKKIEYALTSAAGLTLGHSVAGTTGGLNKALGATEVSPVGVITYVSPVLPSLYGLTRVFVHSTTLSEGNLVDGDVENHDVIGEIPVTVPFGSMAVYESRDDELDSINYGSLRNFDQINISLRDLDNNIIDLNGGVTEIILKLYYF